MGHSKLGHNLLVRPPFGDQIKNLAFASSRCRVVASRTHVHTNLLDEETVRASSTSRPFRVLGDSTGRLLAAR
jgi:hypothetical protein